MFTKQASFESLDKRNLFNEDICEILTVMGGDSEFIGQELILEFE